MNDHGQLVLIASVVIAVALVPMVFAYLQLGYDADVEHSVDVTDPEGDAHRVLVRAVHNASSEVPEQYSWANRSAAVTSVQTNLGPRFDIVETGLIEEGIAREISYNASAATAWANANCPGGVGRQFGPCEADRGVVVQERVNRTHVLRVAVDLETTAERRESSVTWVIDVW